MGDPHQIKGGWKTGRWQQTKVVCNACSWRSAGGRCNRIYSPLYSAHVADRLGCREWTPIKTEKENTA